MIILKNAFNLHFLKIIGLFLVIMLLQSCSAYKKSTNLEEASQVLLNEVVMKVERQNKNSSGFLGVTGITIGIASIILAVLMF